MKAALTQAALVGAGGFAGALLRFALSGWIHGRMPMATFPYGTLAVNLAGCLAIGVVAGLVESHSALGPAARTFVLIGLLGGFTTFSTFGYETFAMLRDAEYGRACANVALQVLAGLACVWAGHALATR